MVAARTVVKAARNSSSVIPLVLATAYGFSLASQSETTEETSLMRTSAWLKQEKMPGRAAVMIWCCPSSKEPQYAASQAAVARSTSAAWPESGSPWASIRSTSSAASRKEELVARSSSAVRRASSAASTVGAEVAGRRRLASRIMAWMRSLAAPARGSTEPVIGCGL